jgi:hypothetical protein
VFDESIPFSVEDILAFNIEPILSLVQRQTCSNFEGIFTKYAQEFENTEEIKSQKICEFFAIFCSFTLSVDIQGEPYRPKMIFRDRRSLIPNDLPEIYLNAALEIVSNIANPELQARIADVLWVLRRGNHQLAIIAGDAYLRSASILENPTEWVEGSIRIERALQLSMQLGRTSEQFKKTINHIEILLDKLNGDDPLWFSLTLMSLLLDHREGDPVRYSALSEKIALAAESNHDWRRAREHWELKARCQQKISDDEAIYESKLCAAKTYVKAADDLIDAEKPNYRMAAGELVSAVQALRQIGAPREYVQQIHSRLLEYQEKDDDFQTVSFEINLRDQVTFAENAVKGKTLREAILILAALGTIPKVEELRGWVIQQQARSPLHFLFSSRQLNHKGRVVANRPPIGFSDEEDTETATRAEMFHQLTLYQDVQAQGLILPTLNQIGLEHNIRLHDFSEFVKDNQFVEPGYEFIFARGLYYGFTGDFMLATHLLLPQIENSIRFYLNQRGVITSKLNSQGIQDDFDLGTLLYMPEFLDAFGPDLSFNLQGLLVNRFSSNLRNMFAHGMMNSNSFSSLRVVYLWWIILFLLCYPTLRQEKPAQKSEETDHNENSQ